MLSGRIIRNPQVQSEQCMDAEDNIHDCYNNPPSAYNCSNTPWCNCYPTYMTGGGECFEDDWNDDGFCNTDYAYTDTWTHQGCVCTPNAAAMQAVLACSFGPGFAGGGRHARQVPVVPKRQGGRVMRRGGFINCPDGYTDIDEFGNNIC